VTGTVRRAGNPRHVAAHQPQEGPGGGHAGREVDEEERELDEQVRLAPGLLEQQPPRQRDPERDDEPDQRAA